MWLLQVTTFFANCKWIHETVDTERLIGDSAKGQAALNPTNTVYGIKRLIGRKFDEATVQQDMKNWPFEVISDKGWKFIG